MITRFAARLLMVTLLLSAAGMIDVCNLHAQAELVPKGRKLFGSATVGFATTSADELVERDGYAANVSLGIVHPNQQSFSMLTGVSLGLTGKVGTELTCQLPGANSKYRDRQCVPLAPTFKYGGIMIGAATRNAPVQFSVLAGPMVLRANCLCENKRSGIGGYFFGIAAEAEMAVPLRKPLSLAFAVQNISLPNFESTHANVRQIRLGFNMH